MEKQFKVQHLEMLWADSKMAGVNELIYVIIFLCFISAKSCF